LAKKVLTSGVLEDSGRVINYVDPDPGGQKLSTKIEKKLRNFMFSFEG
jgi:hypothetical protein